MSFRSFFRRSHAHRKVRRANHGHAVRRPRFEPLEDRRLLSFTPAGTYAAGSNPAAIATADFNKDGNLDLATTVGFSIPRVSVRLGNGAGGFGAAQEYAVPGFNLQSIFTADINNDTRPDIVMSDGEGGSIHTLMANADGTFQPAIYGGLGNVVAVGRFNGDNNIDVMVTWLDGDWATHVQVHSGNGQGQFAPAVNASDGYYWGWGGMAPVDLNNDGHIDVATAEGVVFLGYGNGALQWFNWEQPAPLSSGGHVAAGDFNGDGNADVISAGDDVAVLRGRGDGTFDAPIHHSVSAPHTAVATADFNADGKLDAIVTNRDAATVSVMLGNGDGTLRFSGAFATGTSPSAITVGDFNGDGRPDVAVRDSSNLSVLFNDGNWSSQPPVVGDLNGDGKVNVFDINVVSAHWSKSGPQGDANGDGAVNIFDINLISAHWTASNGEGGGGAEATDSGPLRIAINSASETIGSVSGVLAGDLNAGGRFDIFDINLLSAQWGRVPSSQESSMHRTPEILSLNAVLSNWGHVSTESAASAAIVRAERQLDNLAADIVAAGTSTHSTMSNSQRPDTKRPLRISLPTLCHEAGRRSLAVDEMFGDEDFVTAHWDAHEDATVASVVRGWFRQESRGLSGRNHSR